MLKSLCEASSIDSNISPIESFFSTTEKLKPLSKTYLLVRVLACKLMIVFLTNSKFIVNGILAIFSDSYCVNLFVFKDF